MEIATEKETYHFLDALFFSWGQSVLKSICNEYDLNEDQKSAIYDLIMKPNNWQVTIKDSLT